MGAGFAIGLLEYAVAQGAARDELLAAAGLASELLDDPDGRVPFASYMALMLAAKALTGDPALALHFGENVDVARMSIIGLIGDSCATMLDSWREVNRYIRLAVDLGAEPKTDRFALSEEADGLWLVDTRPFPEMFPELTESAFAQLATRAYRLPGQQLRIVEVAHPDPGYREEYERIFRAPVRFGAGRNAALLDEGWAARPVQLLPRYAFGVLSARGDVLLEALDANTTVRGQVERLLMAVLHTGEARAGALAAQMGMSRQTLFRRLKAEGTSFEKVLDGLRHRLALDYLKGGKVSVSEIAYLVGFADAAAFSRAFRRWEGISPREARAAGLRA